MEPKSFLRTLTVIHASLCMGLVIFAIYAYIQNGSFSSTMDTSDVFIYLVPVVAMIGYFGSKYVHQKLLQNLPASEPLQKKVNRYFVASIVKYALIEGPAFLALFAFFMSGNALNLVIAISLMVYLFFQRPTNEKLTLELPFSLEEKKEFDTL